MKGIKANVVNMAFHKMLAALLGEVEKVNERERLYGWLKKDS